VIGVLILDTVENQGTANCEAAKPRMKLVAAALQSGLADQ